MIAYDTSVQNAGTSWSHTNAGNLLLVWGVTDSGDPTGASYGGQAMTRIATTFGGYLYKLANPPTGANTVALQGAIGTNSNISISYIDSDSVDASDQQITHSTGTVTASPTVVASNCWLVGFSLIVGAQGNAITSTSTMRQEIALGGTGGQTRIGAADSNATVGTGSQSLKFDNAGASTDFIGVVLSIAPVRKDALFFAGD